jgi:hypothetical protein
MQIASDLRRRVPVAATPPALVPLRPCSLAPCLSTSALARGKRIQGTRTQGKRIHIPYPSIVYIGNDSQTWPAFKNSIAKSRSRTATRSSANTPERPSSFVASPVQSVRYLPGSKCQGCGRSVPPVPPPPPSPLLPPPPYQWRKTGCETVGPGTSKESTIYRKNRASPQKL